MDILVLQKHCYFLNKRFIKENTSPCVVPAQLTPKKDSFWPMCVNLGAVNRITIKYNFHIPLLDDLLNSFHGASFFSRINIPKLSNDQRMNERLP